MDGFFDDQSEQSEIKAKIVTSYFLSWSKIMCKHWEGDIGYVDLYCGPGTYKNKKPSVPMLILDKILSDEVLTKRVRIAFNDVNKDEVASLRAEIAKRPGISKIIDRIFVSNMEIDNNFSKRIKIPPDTPVLSFIDPWGYRGLTMDLVNTLISSNGSDCIFFFNYSRINMAFSNMKFDEHLQYIFGIEKTNDLKNVLRSLKPKQREETILNALIEVLTENKANYVLTFKFYGQDQARTSHFIVFVTKHKLGYKIMKQTMYDNSTKDVVGIATFSFEDSHNFDCEYEHEQIGLFPSSMQDLIKIIENEYSEKMLTVGEICNRFMEDKNSKYVTKNVQEALRCLESIGKVKIKGRKQATHNGKITMPEKAYAVFDKL